MVNHNSNVVVYKDRVTGKMVEIPYKDSDTYVLEHVCTRTARYAAFRILLLA